MRILIVDFNDDFFPIYRRKLSVFENLDLKLCKTIEQALVEIEIFKPDCVLLNHYFGKSVNYYDTFRDRGYKGKIVILVAGKEKNIKRSLYNGISGILDKTVNGEDFRSRLNNILKSERAFI